MPALTGAQLYKKDTVMPGGVSYFQLAQTTYQQVMDQWDGSCGGGLFWIRSQTRRGRTRNGESYGYKSTITQSEAILHAAKLGMLTGDQKYLQDGDRIYKWMISSGLIAPNGDVFDGVDAAVDASKGQCSKSNFILSYQKGMASGALALLAGASKNNAYLTTAHTVFQRASQTFLRNNIVFDPCETVGKCDSNKATPKGTLVRGWGMLYEYSNDEAIKAQIKMALRSTVQNMLKTCDASWNCGQDWLQGTPNAAPNLHFQMNAMELMNAYYKTFFKGPVNAGGAGGAVLAAPTQGSSVYVPPPPFNSAVSVFASQFLSTLLLSLFAVFFAL